MVRNCTLHLPYIRLCLHRTVSLLLLQSRAGFVVYVYTAKECRVTGSALNLQRKDTIPYPNINFKCTSPSSGNSYFQLTEGLRRPSQLFEPPPSLAFAVQGWVPLPPEAG